MTYIKDCLNFINEEKKANRIELYRLLNLESAEHNDEGQTINGLEFVRQVSNGYLYKYPNQFTKLREEKRIDIYKDKQKVLEHGTEIISIDYLKNLVVLDCLLESGPYLAIQSLEIVPYSVIKALTQIESNPNPLTSFLIQKKSNIQTEKSFSQENVIKTSQKMNQSFMILQGPPGCGKTYTGKNLIKDLIERKQKILVTSNSHRAIINLLEGIDFELKGAKIYSRSNQKIENKNFKNISPSGKNIDHYVNDYDLVAGTCFSLAKIENVEFDTIIVDEASQLKMSFLLAISRLAKNVIILGDQNQLQSISVLGNGRGGESVLEYLLEGQKIVPKTMGYLLDTTFRMEPQIASLISEVFYENRMKWNQKKNQIGVKLVLSNHDHGQKMSEEEAKDVLKIYRKLIKNKVKPEQILITTPYNAQASLIKSKTNKKTIVGTTDLLQGMEADYVIISLTASGSKKQASEFATNPNRLNVAISRAKKGVWIVSAHKLIKSKDTSVEFQKIIKKIGN